MNKPRPKPRLKMMSLAQLIDRIHHEVQIQGWEADLNHLDVGNLSSFERLFAAHAHGLEPFNGDISRWNLSNALTLKEMFCGSKFKGDVSQWDVSQVVNMTGLFREAEFNGDLSKWDVSKVTHMNYMFMDGLFNQPIGDWDVFNVISMQYMFFNNKNFNQPLDAWNVSRVQSMHGMFAYSNFNQPLDAWNVESLIEAHEMFFASEFNQPLSSWNVKKLHGSSKMFSETPFEHDLSAWDLESLINGFCMFHGSKVTIAPIPKQLKKGYNDSHFAGYIDQTPFFEHLVDMGYPASVRQDPFLEWVNIKTQQEHLEQHLQTASDPTLHPKKTRL